MFVSGVNIQPNRTGLPGIKLFETIVGALLTFGLIAAVAGIAISAPVRPSPDTALDDGTPPTSQPR